MGARGRLQEHRVACKCKWTHIGTHSCTQMRADKVAAMAIRLRAHSPSCFHFHGAPPSLLASLSLSPYTLALTLSLALALDLALALALSLDLALALARSRSRSLSRSLSLSISLSLPLRLLRK
eukprot:6185822-Pleurochrysis_carterae.AAC.1